MMSTAGQAQLTAGLNGPASGLSQLTRRFFDASQIMPRGSTGASGPQLGGISIVSSSKRNIGSSRSAKNARIAGRLRHLRNEVHRHLKKRRSSHKNRHRHTATKTRKRRDLTTTETENDNCKWTHLIIS